MTSDQLKRATELSRQLAGIREEIEKTRKINRKRDAHEKGKLTLLATLSYDGTGINVPQPCLVPILSIIEGSLLQKESITNEEFKAI